MWMLRLCLLLVSATLPVFAAVDARREEATALMQRREWAKAQTLLEATVTAQPTDAESWNLLGQCLLARSDFTAAVSALEKATELAPQASDYFLVLGNAYGAAARKAGLFAQLGLARKCKAAYDRAVVLDPANINARWSVMEYCRQAPGIVGGGMEQAYQQAVEIKRLDARRGRAAYASLYSAEKKYPEAFALYDAVLRENPADEDSLYQIGRLAARSGQQLDRGLACLRELAARPGRAPDARSQTFLGNILEKMGDKPGARTAYEAAVAIDPTFVPAIEALRKLKAA